MKQLIIVGARGWGREVYASAISCAAYKNGEFEVKGFLDDNMHILDELRGKYPPIIGNVESYQIQPDDVFFVAMGDPKWRKYYAEMIEAKKGRFITIICEGAKVLNTVQIGDGSFVGYGAIVSDNVSVGRHAVIHASVIIGHDVCIGNYATLEAFSFVGGGAKIGNNAIMHIRSTLLRKKAIGDDVVVGAQSVVIRNVKDGLHVFGYPAQIIDY